MNRDAQPFLVSVIVECFNSQEYILDALESVKNQTYSRIELIIADDCSTDQTEQICREWIAKNKKRFENCIYAKTVQNSGVAVNCTMGAKLASGKWLKDLAGDDMLPKRAVEKCADYVTKNNIKTVLCTKTASFACKRGKMHILAFSPDPYTKKILDCDARRQHKAMLYDYIIPTEYFISKKFLEKIRYYDTSFPEIEDYPLWLKITGMGIPAVYCDSILGYFHRTQIDSSSQTGRGIMNEAAFKIGGRQHRQDKKYVLPKIPWYHPVFYYHYGIDLLRRYFVITLLKNRNTKANRIINKTFLLLDPVFMKKKLYNMFHAGNMKAGIQDFV